MSNGGRTSSSGGSGGGSVAAVKSAPLWYCLFTCCLYGFGSGSMSFFNKGLVSSLGFHYSQALLSLQMAACVAMFLMARALGWVRFTHPMPKTAHSRWWGRGELYVRLLPLSIAYCGNAMAGMLSLQGLSLPMYSVLKRFTPLLVASAEWVWFGRRTSPRVMAALALCTGGFVLAGLGDLVFDAKAYALAMISCASQAAYMISVERVGKALEMQSHELLYYNSLLSLSMILPWVLYTGELHAALFEYPHWNSPLFLAALGMMVLLGISLNWTMFLCTQVNSPLTTCMVGVIKGVVTTGAGFFMFGGQPTNALNLTGIACNTAGGALYAWAKYRDREDKHSSGNGNAAAATASASAMIKLGSLPPHAHAHQDDDVTHERDRLLLPSGAATTLSDDRDREEGRCYPQSSTSP